MRARSAVLAAGSLALVMSLCAPAQAATGTFTYRYRDLDGDLRIGGFVNPESRECINLSELRGTGGSAHTPRNDTDSTVTVFTGFNCKGDYYSLRPDGGRASERLLLKSAVFS
ncbi:hypothetical protein GCM10022419_075720 [Nonomuraea rosea]|jgi:hypothetical protein|uniref:Uncharacterized protein n=1 Tax=Nonomuraea rosea TaxID=638574 RepID=A0ABP6YL47_9ACTN